MYKLITKNILFLWSPEKAHHLSFAMLRAFLKIPGAKYLIRKSYQSKVNNPISFCGLTFPNIVGLAAGFDKNAALLDVLQLFGFGHVEIGTVTPLPQSGNEKPRLFRLPKDEALINRMGFNNDGADVVVERLKKRPRGLIVGGNIGKNKITPNENAVDDYLICFEKLHPYVDYFVVNVSSPNTPNLRELQDKEPLKKILNRLMQSNTSMQQQKPILLKIAPDLTNEQLDDIVEIVQETKIDGLIATNTTISRDGLHTEQAQIERIGMGGLSGKPVLKKSSNVIKYINDKAQGTIPIIGVGGVFTATDAEEKLDSGAKLVQIYTGFIYEGPRIVKNIIKGLSKK
jgi:dihydroorotate dehydrogenase